MTRSRFLVAGALILGALVGCAKTSEGRVCPLVGVRTGISLNVAAGLAERVSAAQLVVCWDGSCQPRPVTLFPGTTIVDDGCIGSGPEAACSAHAEGTGDKFAFADIADLPPSPVEVTVALADSSDARIVDQTLIITPELVDIPGRECGGRLQGRITVDADARSRSGS